MIKNNKKGISLVEVLIVIAILAFVTPMIFSELLFGLNTYRTYDNYMDQHYTIMEATELIRKDIEISKTLLCEYDAAGTYSRLTMTCPSDPKNPASADVTKIWELSDGKLNLGTGSNKRIILDGINTDTETTSLGNFTMSRFEMSALYGYDINNKISFIVWTDTSKNTSYNFNVNKPIITEYSVRYKNVLPTPTL